MSCPDDIFNTEEFRQNVKRLKQAVVGFSEERHAANRLVNLTSLMAGLSFPSLLYPISEICAGSVPYTISRPQMAVRNIIRAYDFMVGDSLISAAWDAPNAELLFKLALMIEPRRREYDFLQENILWDQCRYVAGFQKRSEWQNILLPYTQWKFHRQQLSWTIGVASLLYLIAKCFRLATNILPYCDFSSVLLNLHNKAADAQMFDVFSDALYSVICSASQQIAPLQQQELETALIPMLELLADGNSRPGKIIMTELGITQRPHFTNIFLKPAIEKQLVEATEANPNSPKQQYRLSAKGNQQIQLARGVIA